MARPGQLDPVLAGVTQNRVVWADTPLSVRISVEQQCHARVTGAASQEWGFSPALAARLTLSTGDRVFVKAIGPDDQSGAPGGQAAYRREARIAGQLPIAAPAPQLLDHWEIDGWVVLLFEDVEGSHPALPWQEAELSRVLHAFTERSARLTPSPVAVPDAAPPGNRNHWQILAAEPALLGRLPDVDNWTDVNLDRLAGMEASFDDAAAGQTLIHSDIRADNLLLTPSRVVVVDWPHAEIGACWLDLLYFLPSVAMQGGPRPEDIFWVHPLARGADRDAVMVVLAALTGFMIHGATQPPPKGLPTLRRFQLAQGREALTWLRTMLD